MSGKRVFIKGTGIICPIGHGIPELKDSLESNKTGIRPLTLFQASEEYTLPAGEIKENVEEDGIPRTHSLALIAANDALTGTGVIPDAIIIGTTTGGMPTTEVHLKDKKTDAGLYRYHSTGSVADYIAEKTGCRGPVITVTTACSSGTAAIKIALELLRSGKAGTVLAGGIDALCRLTYFGFNSLKLIDPDGARPLDKNRLGMTVSEGSSMLLLVSADEKPDEAKAEILGAGLSCDAYHPAAPHPDGEGAVKAMKSAIDNAGISPSDIDYINLHGTGTKENDLAEAKAVKFLFKDKVPFLSSTKGATGHPLAAAGAIEAVISTITISSGLIPANTGCTEPDPELDVKPLLQPVQRKTGTVLSNSFGFGGNNASLVLSDPDIKRETRKQAPVLNLEVLGSACITGAGDLDSTMEKIFSGEKCGGALPSADVSKKLPPREVRRLKRLPRIALSLAIDAHENSGLEQTPSAIFFGTAWGPLSETYDFLTKLYESGEQFTSPTDFVGSVHNAPAGQIAIKFKSTGPNITVTGGDYSFEQALMTAELLAKDTDGTMLIMGADETHEQLSPLFDRSIENNALSDGGGAVVLKPTDSKDGMIISLSFFENTNNNTNIIESLVNTLGGAETINDKFGLILAGIPAACRETGENQLEKILSITEFSNPVIDYRKITGEFASASAVASAISVRLLSDGKVPALLTGNDEHSLNGKGILLLGLGSFVTGITLTK